MRVAGILGIAVLLAGCGSGPAPAPRPDPVPLQEVSPAPAWSAWSEPVKGLSCRALLPGQAPRGERIPVTVEFRLDPALLPEGKKYVSLREDQGRLVLRKRGGEVAAPVSIEYSSEKVLESPALEEEGAPPLSDLERHPDWSPLADAVAKPREFRFSLARAWDALAPGEWEARFEIDAYGAAESPSLWSGTLVSVPVPLVIEEPPPRRIRALVPSQLRVRPGDARGSVVLGFGEGDGDFADLEPRHGFRMVLRTGTDECFSWGLLDEDWKGFEFGDWFDDVQGAGPLDRTLDIEIVETIVDREDSDSLLGLDLFGSKPPRVLWKKTFQVTATAAEIEALRR